MKPGFHPSMAAEVFLELKNNAVIYLQTKEPALNLRNILPAISLVPQKIEWMKMMGVQVTALNSPRLSASRITCL